MVFALSYKACRRLIRVAFVSPRARRLEVCILIVLPRIAYTAAFSRGKVFAGCLFGLAWVGFSVSILTFLGSIGLANFLATRLSKLSSFFWLRLLGLGKLFLK